jgi:hypothetical protein
MHILDAILGAIRSWGEPLVDEWVEKLVAKCKAVDEFLAPLARAECGFCRCESPGIWDGFHVSDGRLVTGMNFQGVRTTAQVVVEAFCKV